MAKYKTPSEVVSPKKNWGLIAVLDDEGTEGGSALAIGRWDGKVALAMRWNGDDARPNGNPQSRAVPTWFIVPDKFCEDILQNKGLARDKVTMARSLFSAS